MRNLYQSIRSEMAALLAVGCMTVGTCCIAHNLTPNQNPATNPEPVKQELVQQESAKQEPVNQELVNQESVQQSVQQEQKDGQTQKKTPLEEMLENIGNFYEKKDINFLLLEDARLTYLLAREDLDKDGIKDYILVAGLKNDSDGMPYPKGLGSILIEDRSKDTGLGIIDRFLKYGEPYKISRSGIKELQKCVKDYSELKKTEPDYEKRLKEMQTQIMINKKNLRWATIVYFNVVSDIKDWIKK